MSVVATALASVLEGLVDHAGLFPPAQLAMDAAVARHAAYRAGPDRAVLGRFILPLARLDEFAAAHARLAPEARGGWRLSVLAGPDPTADRDRIASYHAAQSAVRVVAVEAKPGTEEAFSRSLTTFAPALELWIELDPESAELEIRLAALRAAGRGAKLRLGGVTAEAFPATAAVARFLRAASAEGVVFKATAGLHHPIRGDYSLTAEPAGPRTRMFGFLNLLLAAAAARGGATEDEVAALLEISDSRAFRPEAETVVWRGRRFDAATLRETRRDLFRSFGSCSFEEPVDGLRSLSWIR